MIDVVTMNQLQARLEESNKEIFRLRTENESLQEELQHVKTRNKKLCQLLFQGESEFCIFFRLFYNVMLLGTLNWKSECL